nr:hypothetical protein GZ17A3_33 [uncultured archaeon GZfos17A3]
MATSPISHFLCNPHNLYDQYQINMKQGLRKRHLIFGRLSKTESLLSWVGI